MSAFQDVSRPDSVSTILERSHFSFAEHYNLHFPPPHIPLKWYSIYFYTYLYLSYISAVPNVTPIFPHLQLFAAPPFRFLSLMSISWCVCVCGKELFGNVVATPSYLQDITADQIDMREREREISAPTQLK